MYLKESCCIVFPLCHCVEYILTLLTNHIKLDLISNGLFTLRSGLCKLWSVPDGKLVRALRGSRFFIPRKYQITEDIGFSFRHVS